MLVENRNFLAHHFFLAQKGKFGTEEDRFALLGELLATQERFRQAAAMAGGIRVALSNAVLQTKNMGESETVFTFEVDLPDVHAKAV